MITYGTAFRWFAWHPVHTDDRGWRWLRPVWRSRCYMGESGMVESSWAHRVVAV